MTVVRTAKEVARHALLRANADRFIQRRRLRGGQDTTHLELTGRNSVFGYIYDHGLWQGDVSDGALSGAGSDLESTTTIRSALRGVLDEVKARTLLDIGCGDFTWMQQVDLSGIEYVGVDVVRSVIEANAVRYASDERRFEHLDAAAEPLPTAEAVLCREVLFHLSLDDCRAVIDNVCSSGARYLLATSDGSTAFNSDIRTGDFRCLNLRKRPFRFPSPIHWVADDAVHAARGVGVWAVDQISSGPSARALSE
jgi:SAM-dependent methyltransferase